MGKIKFNDLSKLTVKDNDIETWISETHYADDWFVGKDSPVQALGSHNDGAVWKSDISSGVKLCLKGIPGEIYVTIKLEKDNKYTFRWADSRDHHGSASVPADQYTVYISQTSGVLPSNATANYKATYTSAKEGWGSPSFPFTPTATGTYYLSFRGVRQPGGQARGAIISQVTCEAENTISEKLNVKLDTGAEITLKQGQANDQPILMHLVNEHGGGVGDAHLVLTLENGDAQVMFNVEGNPQQQKFTTDSDGGLVGNFTLRKEQLKAGTKIGGAKLHVSMNSELIGTVNIRVVASTAWALVADPTTVTVDVSGSKDVKLILKEDGIGKIGEVLEVDIDKENISGEKTLKTDTDGVATLKLGGKIPGTATVTVTHTRSKAQAIVKVEVTAVTGKHYTLKPEPATLKVELSTQKDFKVVVWDNSKNQAAGRGIAVTVTVDSKDLKDLKVGPNTDQTTDTKTTDDQGEVTFTFAGTKPETTTLTLSASDAEEVKIPLSVGVSSTLYLIQSDKPAVSILAGQTIANAPIHISVVPHDGDAPKIVHFNIIKTGLFVMVKAKDAIWRTHGDIVLDKNGNGIIDEIRAANITEKTYQIDLTATDAKPISIPVTVQSLMLNVQPASTDANPLSLPGAGQDPMPITSGMTGCVVMVSLAETHPLKPAPVGTEVDFVIVNPSSASNLAQFVLAGGALDLKASGQVKSETGLIALPTFKLTNSQLGHFHIDVYAKGQTIPAGHFYFLVREAQPIVKIEFDAEKHTGTGGYPFSPGYVVAYVNDHERVPAMPGEGRVNFTIEGPNTYYFTGSEPHSQTASVLIGRGGRAVIPQITLETAAGSFTILASSGNAKATKSNPYEVD